MRKELKKIEDKSIKCHGIVTNEEVVIAEKKATLLINPRPTGEEFTKFSFSIKEYGIYGIRNACIDDKASRNAEGNISNMYIYLTTNQ